MPRFGRQTGKWHINGTQLTKKWSGHGKIEHLVFKSEFKDRLGLVTACQSIEHVVHYKTGESHEPWQSPHYQFFLLTKMWSVPRIIIVADCKTRLITALVKILSFLLLGGLFITSWSTGSTRATGREGHPSRYWSTNLHSIQRVWSPKNVASNQRQRGKLCG